MSTLQPSTDGSFANGNDFEIQKMLEDLKSNLLSGWSLSVFIFLSATTLNATHDTNRLMIYGLISIGILALLLSISSFSDQFYNSVPESSITPRHQIDAALYIAMSIIFVIVQVIYVVYYLETGHKGKYGFKRGKY